MSFDWSEYLTLARHLISPGAAPVSAEATLRCAISRSYYAVFCSVRNYLRDHNLHQPANTGKDHEDVPRSLRDNGFPQLATSMDRLRQRRRRADYDDEILKLHAEARFAVMEADFILGRLPRP